MSLSAPQKILKRGFDLVTSFIGLILFSWLIFIAFLIASIDTKGNGFFTQKRVGRHSKLFDIIKIRTMRKDISFNTCVTTDLDPRITAVGRFFRKTKIDELPQLINIFLGKMSFVGPRPDMPGFADKLEGEDRIILSIRPGITGPATLTFRDEEKILSIQDDPENYNMKVIFPEKIRLNKEYIKNYSFFLDLKYIFKTIFT